MSKGCIILAAITGLLVGEVGMSAPKSDQPVTVTIKRLSLDTAMRMGKAAIDKCRKEGVQVTVTVVDRGGHDQIVMRDSLAMHIAAPISKKKAATAMAFNTPTSQLEGRFTGSYGVPKLDELIIGPGGIPISVGGNIMGGIGVSGAPSGKTDEACAQAGLDAVRSDLEIE